MDATTYTRCQICEQGCGLAVESAGDRILRIRPDKQNPYSWRDFCIKAATANQIVEHPRRIRVPMRRAGDRYVESSYEEAVRDIGSRLRAVIGRGGPDGVACYLGSSIGSFANTLMLTALMDGIGTRNRYWVGSIDQNAAHVVLQAMYGSPWTTLIPDIDACDCLLLIGANPAISKMSWLGSVPDGWRRFLVRQRQGAELIVVDPRRTETARHADLHVAPLPEQDWALLLGVLQVIFAKGWTDAAACREAAGIEALEELAQSASLAELARRCDVAPETIAEVAQRFARARTAAAVARTGSGLGRHGVLTEWLCHALNLVTGRTDRPGGRVFNPGLVDPKMLAAAAGTSEGAPSRVRGLEPVAGYRHLAELPDEIETPGPGRVRALFLSGGNPVVSGPEGRRVDRALRELELLVSIDFFQRESHRHAHWLLPAVHFLESEQLNPLIVGLQLERYAQYSRRAVAPPPGVREEWSFFVDLALEMGVPLFGQRGVNTLVRATRAMARLLRRPGLGFDPGWIARYMVWRGGRVRWSDVVRSPHGLYYDRKRYGELAAQLPTPGARIQACPESFARALRERLAAPLERDAAYPLQLISRRRTHMLNSTLTETTARQMRDGSGDRVELNRSDAAQLGVTEGQPVQVRSRVARVEAVARLSDAVRPGVCTMEQGWGGRLFDPVRGGAPELRGVTRNLLVSGKDLDPFSGVPRLNGTPVRVEAVPTSGSRRRASPRAP